MEMLVEKREKDPLTTVSNDVDFSSAYGQHKTTDRVLNYVRYPEVYRAKEVDIWDRNKILINYLRDFFRNEGRLTESCAVKIIQEAAEILKNENNVLDVSPPVNICGDIHGQYYDLLSVFKAGGGDIPRKRYLFLGDYVDRGAFSCEAMLYLFALKINFPTCIYLLRGNHESRQTTKKFSFKTECILKYSTIVYEEFMKAFDCLPLAAVVAGRFFCVHAGIGPELVYVSDINKINRFVEIPLCGTFCDLMWSDPARLYDTNENIPDFSKNTTRKASYFYSYKACCSFLRRNKLSSLVRSHSIIMEGYKIHRATEFGYPSVLSVFSAPNYVDVYGNKAAIIEFDGKMVTAIQFSAAPHPCYLPKFMNGISFTLPFITAKVSEIIYAVLKRCTDSVPNRLESDNMFHKNSKLHRKVNAYGRAVLISYEVLNYYTNHLKLGPLAPPANLTVLHSEYVTAVKKFLRGSRDNELLDRLEKFYDSYV